MTFSDYLDCNAQLVGMAAGGHQIDAAGLTRRKAPIPI